MSNNYDLLTVHSLIQSGTCDVNIQDSDGRTTLYIAASNGNIEIVRCLLGWTECDVNIQDSSGDTPLHIAVMDGNIEIVRCLIENTNCDVNMKDEGNLSYTPLHLAVHEGNIEIVRCLTNHTECDVNLPDVFGHTPLHKALRKSNIEIVRCLIENNTCIVNIRDNGGYTPLHTAVKEDDIELVRCLLDRPECDVNIQDRRRNTPLHIAVQKSIDNGMCLHNRPGCDVNIQDNLRTIFKEDKIVRCLLNRPECNVNIQDREGDTPLYTAVRSDKRAIVRCLLNRTDCDVNIQDIYGDTPLYTAVQKRYISIVSYLLDRTECDVNIQDSDGNTPLCIAVRGGYLGIVRYLLDRTECDVNIQDTLHTALKNKYIEIVRCLLNRSECNVNIRDGMGNTPLHTAISYNLEIVSCLLNRPACNVNIQNTSGETPLYIAVRRDNIDIVRCLLNRPECNVNIQNTTGDTPLYIAVRRDNRELVRCLLNRTECNVNIQDREGDTPLYTAVRSGNREMVRYLLNRTECNVNIQNNRGDTPLYIAVRYSKITIVRCLLAKAESAGYASFYTTAGLETLHEIAKCPNVELFHVLIQHNVDVLTNHVDNQLHLVKFILSKNDFQSLWFFIQNGLYINCLTSSGENIVHLLAKFYLDYLYLDFRFLFDYGLDFDLINNDGNSPLMVASLLNNLPFIQCLAVLPCDVNRQNHQGHTALHLCVIGFTLTKEKLNMMKVNTVVTELCAREYYPRYLACIDTLLNLGADVNMQDISGKTVLMLACMKNDKKLLKTLLNSGAGVNIVDNYGRSALQYIDLTNNVYDLTCFDLLLPHGCRQSFNQPWLNGNTIIQNLLFFTPLWPIDHTVNFIKFLVFKNVNLQLLTSDDGEISYGQLSLDEFSSESRHELRRILYLSGGPFLQITQILHFEAEENYEASLPESLREKPKEKFYLFANNLSLAEICRRVIRQNTGLAIHDRTFSELLNIQILIDFLMLKYIDLKPFSLPVQLDSFIIDDDYDDDYNSYDLNKENDDYGNDYMVYEDCKYLNEVHAGFFRPIVDYRLVMRGSHYHDSQHD